MGKLKEFVKHLKSIRKEELIETLNSVVENREKEIGDLVRRQLMAGVDGDGHALAPYKSEWYAKFKKTLNPRGVTDLKLHGFFHENIFVARGVPLIIWSYDEKTDDLTEKYGRQILQLDDESKEVLIRGYIREDYKKEFRKLIFV